MVSLYLLAHDDITSLRKLPNVQIELTAWQGYGWSRTL